jgi:Family of unknown function (DUF5719)
VNICIGGLVRASLAAVAGVGVVAAAAQLPGALAVGPEGRTGTATRAATTAVRGSGLVCPGPELKGVPGIGDLPVGVRVAAATAPARTLTGTDPVDGAGRLAVGGMPSGALAKPVDARSRTTAGDVTTATGALVTATQSLAPGLAAAQSWFAGSGNQRALAGAPCGQPAAEHWILAGGAGPGRQERLLLTNPGGNAVTVDVTLHGPQGRVTSPQGKGIVVPAHGRTGFLLDSITGDLAAPAVHVVAEGGVVGALIPASRLDGTRSGGSDDAVPAAAPSRDQVVPGVAVHGAASLRVAVPGDTEAVVQARVLTTRGPRALPTGGVLRLEPGTTRDVDLSTLPAGAVAIQVRADVPVVAGVLTTRTRGAGAPGDLAWTASTPAIHGVAGMPLVDPAGAPRPLGRQLAVSAVGASAGVEVVTVDAAGVEKSQRLAVPADSTLSVAVTGTSSVWLHRVSGSGRVHAGVISAVGDASGTLLSVAPLAPAALTITSVGLREKQP